jgi:hypothetical protein
VIDFEATGADALRAGLQAKQAAVLAQVRVQQGADTSSTPAAPPFVPPAEDDDEDEGLDAAGSAVGAGVMGWLSGLRQKVSMPAAQAASLPPLKLELRPLEGAEHFFDEPYSDYYFYYDESEGGKAKGGGAEGKAAGSPAAVHVRPGVQDEAVHQRRYVQYAQGWEHEHMPYDDPEDSLDEQDYDPAELLLLGPDSPADSSKGAAGGPQETAAAAGSGGQQQQQRPRKAGATAEL